MVVNVTFLIKVYIHRCYPGMIDILKTQRSNPKLSEQKVWWKIKLYIWNIYKYSDSMWASYLDQSVWYRKCRNVCISSVWSCTSTLEMCIAMMWFINIPDQEKDNHYSQTTLSIRFHIFHIIARFTDHGIIPLKDKKICHICKQEYSSETSKKLYTRKELVKKPVPLS